MTEAFFTKIVGLSGNFGGPSPLEPELPESRASSPPSSLQSLESLLLSGEVAEAEALPKDLTVASFAGEGVLGSFSSTYVPFPWLSATALTFELAFLTRIDDLSGKVGGVCGGPLEQEEEEEEEVFPLYSSEMEDEEELLEPLR